MTFESTTRLRTYSDAIDAAEEVSDPLEGIGCHRTDLAEGGLKADVDPPKRVLGRIIGGAIKLSPDADASSCRGRHKIVDLRKKAPVRRHSMGDEIARACALENGWLGSGKKALGCQPDRRGFQHGRSCNE